MVVDAPGRTRGCQLLEYGLVVVEAELDVTRTIGCRRVREVPVRPGLSGDGAVPRVAHREFPCEVREHWRPARRIEAAHDVWPVADARVLLIAAYETAAGGDAAVG